MSTLQQAFDAGFDAVKGYVDRSIDALAARVKALEERPTPRTGGKRDDR